MFKYLKNNRTGEKTPFKTTLRYSMKGEMLAFFFDCEKSECFSAYSDDNEPIYLGDVAELFLGVGENPQKYFEIEVAPNGAVFFAEITNDGDEKKVKFLPTDTITAETERTESGYKVSVFVPERIFGNLKGRKIYFNAFRIETEGGETEKNLIALNPTLNDTFHVPDKFIRFDED